MGRRATKGKIDKEAYKTGVADINKMLEKHGKDLLANINKEPDMIILSSFLNNLFIINFTRTQCIEYMVLVEQLMAAINSRHQSLIAREEESDNF